MDTTKSPLVVTWADVPCKFAPALAREATRYAIGAALVTPCRPDDNGAAQRVYITGTDGRKLAVVPAAGESPAGEVLAPRAVLPGTGKGGRIELADGWNWKCHVTGKFAPREDNARFPASVDVLPDAHAVDGTGDTVHTVALGINARLLFELATALGSDKLTLLIPAPDAAADGGVTGAVPVLASESEGFGVIMPLTTGAPIAALRDRFADRRTTYADARDYAAELAAAAPPTAD